MLEVLQFVFSSFWVWLGTVILLWIVVLALGTTISIFFRR